MTIDFEFFKITNAQYGWLEILRRVLEKLFFVFVVLNRCPKKRDKQNENKPLTIHSVF